MLRDVFIVKDGNITTESCKRCGGSGCGQCAVDYDYHSCTYCSCHGDAQRIQYYHDTCGGCGQNPGPWTCTCFSPWTSGDCSIGPPTVIPTRSPSLYPSPDPTMKPTESPTYIPSLSPTTSFPSVQPSYRPSTTTPTQTRLPSRYPTYNPRTVIYESHHPFDQVLDVMNLEVKLEGASQYEIAFDPLTDLRGFQIGFYVSDSETAGKYTPSYTGSANVTVYPGVGRPAIIITTDFFYLRVARLETKLRKDLESTSTWGFSVQVTPLM